MNEIVDLGVEIFYIGNYLQPTKNHLEAYGGDGYKYAVTGFKRIVLSNGVSEEAWATITVDNPKRALCIE